MGKNNIYVKSIKMIYFKFIILLYYVIKYFEFKKDKIVFDSFLNFLSFHKIAGCQNYSFKWTVSQKARTKKKVQVRLFIKIILLN